MMTITGIFEDTSLAKATAKQLRATKVVYGEDGTKYMVEPAISDHPSSYGTYTVSVKTTSRRLAAEVAREFHDNCKKVYENRD